MNDFEIEEILAEESDSSFNPMEYLRTGYQHVTYLLNYVLYLIQDYGWHLVFGGIVFYYIFTKFLRPILESTFGSYETYKKRKEEWEYDAKYHKDPDAFSARISAQQAYAQKLQDKYDEEAQDYQAKLKEKEARKKQEVLNLLNQEGGHTLGGSNDTKPKSFRPEYNPLMGPGSSSNYRPPKKSKCGGGGCGK